MSNYKPILTIIVPSYNVEKYVDECVPTYIEKQLLLSRIAVFFIDDGATDTTKEKLLPYIHQYPFALHFVHKENGGHGSVINYGVSNCVKTKYFKVIDGDDWVDGNSLLQLTDYLLKCDDDMIITDYNEVVEGNNKLVKCKKYPDKQNLSNFLLSIHSLTYKTNIFTDNNIRLREGVFYEDTEYVFFPLQYIRTFSYLPLPVYQYRLGNASQSVSIQSRICHRNDLLLIEEDMLNLYKELLSSVQANSEALFLVEKSLSYFFANDIIFAITESQDSREFRNAIADIRIRINSNPNIEKQMRGIKSYRVLKLLKFHPFFLLKRLLKGRFC